MKTALVTTTYLEPEVRLLKTQKFIDYYTLIVPQWDLIVLDNASPLEICYPFYAKNSQVQFQRYVTHYGRPSHLDYKYLWRAVWEIKNILEEYDKVVYMDNDFFIRSGRMVQFINELKDGWTTFWCPRFTMPETGCHVVAGRAFAYHDWIVQHSPDHFNGRYMMETVLPCTVDKTMVGDRYFEDGDSAPYAAPAKDYDFWAQARLEQVF